MHSSTPLMRDRIADEYGEYAGERSLEPFILTNCASDSLLLVMSQTRKFFMKKTEQMFTGADAYGMI